MKKARGQSLIEMVVVIGLTGVALVGIALAATVGTKNARVAKERAIARDTVRQTMETIRNTRDTDPKTFFAMSSHTDTLSAVGTSPIYNRQAVYSVVIAGSKIQVTVTVTWVDGDQTFNVQESTYLQKW